VIINKDSNNSAANIFAFGTFAKKNSDIVYHNLTGLFPFVLLEGSVCFFFLSLQIERYYCRPNNGVRQ
jgi:hypothetical protein